MWKLLSGSTAASPTHGAAGVACHSTVWARHSPIIGVVDALNFVDGNLAQQRDGLRVPVEDQGVVLCNHWVVATADVLRSHQPGDSQARACKTPQILAAIVS